MAFWGKREIGLQAGSNPAPDTFGRVWRKKTHLSVKGLRLAKYADRQLSNR